MKNTDPGRPDDILRNPEEFLERFLEELEQTRQAFEWQLVPDQRPGTDVRAHARYRLRGVCRGGRATGTVFEPIGAMCYVATGEIYDEDNWSAAGHALGLPSLCVAELIAAANDHTWTGPTGTRRPVEHLEALRHRLIRAVGLGISPSPVERMRNALGSAGRKSKRGGQSRFAHR